MKFALPLIAVAISFPVFAQNEEVDLTGVIDMHVHAGPDSRPRAMNDWEAVRMAEAAGLRAVLLKNQFTGIRLYSWRTSRDSNPEPTD